MKKYVVTKGGDFDWIGTSVFDTTKGKVEVESWENGNHLVKYDYDSFIEEADMIDLGLIVKESDNIQEL